MFMINCTSRHTDNDRNIVKSSSARVHYYNPCPCLGHFNRWTPVHSIHLTLQISCPVHRIRFQILHTTYQQLIEFMPRRIHSVFRAKSIEVSVGITFLDSDRFNSCQVIYSQFGLAIHQNDHQARHRFVEFAQNEMAVVPDFHKRILFSDGAHFWLNGYVNKQNCRIWSEANPQVYVETPLHPEKLTVWCALWAGGILLQKR
ncbi:hypothetical protein TNCV_1974371 [Trichonephila clavipes]|nr:hypothetical protein TNCV_1974371 [Trichonephila clavipes]